MTAMLLLASMLLQGCAAGPFRLQYLWPNDDGLSYYVDKASAIEYPVETSEEPTDPLLFNAPRNIRSPEEATPREIKLNECIRLALAESAAILDDASFGSPGNPILSRPAQAASIFDPAIQNTGFLFGNRGVEAALADFDALATTSITWGRDEVPQNVANSGILPGGTLTQETMSYQSRLEKPLVTGGTVSLEHQLNYDGNNRTPGTQLFQSSYSGLVQARIRQPLLAGSGVEFNRIAGPQNQSLRGVSGVSQGVLISRINNDISLTQFEQSVLTLVRDVEQRYWDLDLALRLYESEKDAFDQLVEYRNFLKSRNESGVPILQTESQIFQAEARLRGSLTDVLGAEARLRRLCHLPLNDDTFLYPADPPTEAELNPMWEASLQEALSHRVELRRQKWEIKSLELQLTAAESLTRPRLDMVSQYRRNGLGNRAYGGGSTMGGDIGSGQNEGWDIGFEFSVPIGLRTARIQQRNYEMRLRKAKAMLGEQEREIAYELAEAMREMQRWYELADSTTRRIKKSEDYVFLADQQVKNQEYGSPELFNLLLQAKIQHRDAEQAYMQSIISYNKAITDLKFRKGTLLTDNGVHLAEGNWHPAAYPIAMMRAEARSQAWDAHKLQTSPMEFVGQAGANSWESLGNEARPSTPGALDAENFDAGQAVLPGQPVPEIPPPNVIQPQPTQPPTGGDSLPVPGNDLSIPMDLNPQPVPPAGDDPITHRTNSRAAQQEARWRAVGAESRR